MALTFPLAPAEWMDVLAVQDVTFSAQPQVEMSQTGAGEFLRRQMGPTLWSGSVTTRNFRYDCGAERAALLGALQEPGASFLVYNKRKQFPAGDPDGVKLGSFTPTLGAVAGSGDVTINGLPGLYWLRAGDYFGFTYGSNPTRYALHQVVADKRANSSGVVSGLVVHPRIRSGWVAGASVTLIKPVCKAVVVPGSVSEAVYGPVAMSGLSFRWQQTLR